jgi:hypothetical protein
MNECVGPRCPYPVSNDIFTYLRCINTAVAQSLLLYRLIVEFLARSEVQKFSTTRLRSIAIESAAFDGLASRGAQP